MTQPEPHEHDARHSSTEAAPDRSARGLGDTLSWAFELESAGGMGGALWLTREIVAEATDPFCAMLDASTTLAHLEELKNAYKLLRTTSVSSAERNLAARLYVAAIAAALVRYGVFITQQKSDALIRALGELNADESMPANMRELALGAIDIVGTLRR